MQKQRVGSNMCTSDLSFTLTESCHASGSRNAFARPTTRPISQCLTSLS